MKEEEELGLTGQQAELVEETMPEAEAGGEYL